jgi:hypothetical protein
VKGTRRDAATFGSIMKKRMTESDDSNRTVLTSPNVGVLTTSLEDGDAKGGPLVPFNTRLSPTIYRALKLFCAEHDLKQQVVIAEALNEYLEKRKKA